MDLEWYTIDMETITEQRPVRNPDLSDVVEIGFTDLMPGGQSNACSRLDWIEVYGYNIHETRNDEPKNLPKTICSDHSCGCGNNSHHSCNRMCGHFTV
jgi:hypothetical protein